MTNTVGAEPTPPEAKPLHGFFIFVLSCVAVVAGLLAADGTGTILACYFIFAVFVIPLLTVGVGKLLRRRKRIGQLLFLVLTGFVSFGTSYITSYRPPASIFQTCFAMAPPPGVTEMKGRVKWYDGQIYVLRFVSTDAAFQAIKGSRGGLKDDATFVQRDTPAEVQEWTQRWWTSRMAMFGRMADPTFADFPAVANPQLYSWENTAGAGTGKMEFLHVFRDPATGMTWVVFSWT